MFHRAGRGTGRNRPVCSFGARGPQERSCETNISQRTILLGFKLMHARTRWHIAILMASTRPLDSGAFTRVTAFPKARGTLSLNYHEGVLVVANGDRLWLSADRGASFVEVATDGVDALGSVAKYAAERLFVMNTRGTLYVRKFVPPGRR